VRGFRCHALSAASPCQWQRQAAQELFFSEAAAAADMDLTGSSSSADSSVTREATLPSFQVAFIIE
jgi:hypothetical protein